MLKPDGVNVAELIRDGLILQTLEAVALVHEACRRAREADESAAFAGAPDDLWLSDAGELHVLATPANAITDVRLAAAALLDALLPPESELPAEWIVPSSLRTLPGRLRDFETPAESGHVRDLLWILKRHLPRDPRAVLHDLTIRVSERRTAAKPGRRTSTAADRSIAPPTAALIPVTRSDSALPILNAKSEMTYSSQQQPHDDVSLDVFKIAAPNASIAAPLSQSRRHATRAIVAVLLIAISAYAGYSGTRSWTFSNTSTPIDDPSVAHPNPGALHKSLGTSGRDAEASVTEPTDANGVTEPLILPVGDDTFSPSFAPSGQALFFHAGRRQGRLLQAELDSHGTVQRITDALGDPEDHNTSSDYHARVSPDGRLIAFDSDRDGERGVYVASRGGADARRVSGNGFAAAPSWSPDMKWLAFVRGEPTNSSVWNLWLLNVASGTLTRLTSFPAGQSWGASWFADSRRLCYSHATDLIVQDVDTGLTATYRAPQAARLVRTPAVSPGGDRIVFQVYRDGVWMLNLPTMSMRRILNDATAEEFAWDPEGRRIAYHSRRDGQWRIWTTTTPRS